MMTEYEEIMNSGKIYKVMGLTNEDTHYHEYLQMMEKYNSLGYTEEGEKEKQRILKNCLPILSGMSESGLTENHFKMNTWRQK